MTALTDLLKKYADGVEPLSPLDVMVIQAQADGYPNVDKAAAQLAAQQTAIEAARRLEIEVKPMPNGNNKVLVSWDAAIFEELAEALAALEALR